MLALDSREELLTFEELHGHVDGVVTLEDSVELEDILVAELPENVDFVQEGFFALVLGVGGLFGEGLDCDQFVVLEPLGQVD